MNWSDRALFGNVNMRGYHILANFCLCTCKSLIGGEADVYTFSLFKAVIKAVFLKLILITRNKIFALIIEYFYKP